VHFTELRETLIVARTIYNLGFKEVNLRFQVVADHLVVEHEKYKDSLV